MYFTNTCTKVFINNSNSLITENQQYRVNDAIEIRKICKVSIGKYILAIGWDAKRELSKINYRIHTDVVKEFLITSTLSPQEMAYTYASEANILNMALFGKTAAQWRSEKGISGKTPNIRDFASAEELVVLINLEDTNADLIRQEVPKIERLKILRKKAYRQLELLKKNQGTIEALRKNLIEDA